MVYLMYYTKNNFSSFLQNELGFFSVFMCNFCCIPQKEYFKENLYKILFCVLKWRGDCLSSLGHLCWRMWEESIWVFRACWCLYTDSIVLPSFLKPCRPWAALRLRKVTLLRSSSTGTRESLMALRWSGQNSQGLGLPPCEGGGFRKGPDLGGLLKVNQRQLFTAPRTPLLFLVLTQWQMVFLPFYDYKWFFEKMF